MTTARKRAKPKGKADNQSNVIESALRTLFRLDREAKGAKAAFEGYRPSAIAAMKDNAIKTALIGVDGESVSATLVEGERLVIDEALLISKLDKRQLGKIMKPVVDRELLEAAVKLGHISADLVASCSEMKPSAAYIKFTEKK